ncbi:oxalurate catabolism protein HpxZ [Pararobbsia silviterrae]|uniref:Oxalurate catabolism protein HpxZ n=1 Tax=Pararobbsia silviterrae TaxID=1792498 RepID=A0A494XXW3_9BURK|nr:oxalurate catabolism protein HpxZ [Pararobbsia silviterrae]RKP54765.1 oxalurate catabolism protein HpxZ [Pararobbsia silviterrae]
MNSTVEPVSASDRAVGAGSVDLAQVAAEVRAAFDAYEAALVRHDNATVCGFFWESPQTIRYGVSEHSHGIEAIRAYRADAAPVHPQRRLRQTTVVAYSADSASACTQFLAPDTTLIGRQSQMWIRFPEGWKIVSAHVSNVKPDRLTVY